MKPEKRTDEPFQIWNDRLGEGPLRIIFIRFLNTLPLAVGIPLIPSPRWERALTVDA